MFFDYKKGNNLYMVNNIEENYPNLTWAQFAICNDDATGAFEVNPQTWVLGIKNPRILARIEQIFTE